MSPSSSHDDVPLGVRARAERASERASERETERANERYVCGERGADIEGAEEVPGHIKQEVRVVDDDVDVY